MQPHMSIKIDVGGSDEGITASVADDATRSDRAQDAPAPMPLEQLRSVEADADKGPPPVDPAVLALAESVTVEDGAPPGPLPLEQLRSAAEAGDPGPSPMEFGALEADDSDSAGPGPSSRVSVAAAEADDAPAPMALEELEALAKPARKGRK